MNQVSRKGLASRTNNRTLWLASAAVSGGLLCLLFLVVNPSELGHAFAVIDLRFAGLALLLLTIEALSTAWRIQTCAKTGVSYAHGVYANAWYVLWITLLPARLGEIAGISVFQKVLLMHPGRATASLIVQRLYDLVILGGFLVIGLSVTLLPMEAARPMVLAILFLMSCLIVSLTFWLTCLGKLIYPLKGRYAFASKLLRFCLHARQWCKQHMNVKAVLLLTLQTLLKWLANLTALLLLFYACKISLPVDTLFVVAILTHFLAAIPLQSIGGIGIVEAGLTSMLVYFGITAEQAIATSLFIRIVVIGYCGIFFTSVYLYFRNLPNHG